MGSEKLLGVVTVSLGWANFLCLRYSLKVFDTELPDLE